MKRKIEYGRNFGFNRHIALVESVFEGIKGIRIERITPDFVEVRVKRFFPGPLFSGLAETVIREIQKANGHGVYDS